MSLRDFLDDLGAAVSVGLLCGSILVWAWIAQSVSP